MPMFRVYIRRPSTQSPYWDWAQTVSASASSMAIMWAYQSWVESNPSPAAPPLASCVTQVKPIQVEAQAEAMALHDSVPPASAAFMQALQDKVAQSLSTQLDGSFELANVPAGFNYGITYGNNAYFNPATVTTIDSLLLVSTNGNLALSGQSFSSLYAQVLQATAYQFSQADQQTMTKQDNAASAQVASILTEFINAGGTYSSPLPLGGKLQDVFNQLNAQYHGLNNLPSSLNALRNAIASYQATAAQSYTLHNRYYLATARLAAAQANLLTPTAANGGMQTGPVSYVPGYTPANLPSANQLIGSLDTTSNKVNVSVSLSQFSSNASQMSVDGQVGFGIPIADILNIDFGGSASYNLSRYTSSSSSVSMSMTYPGITLVSATPSALSLDNSTGWFDEEMLSEIASKSGQDATGYALQGHAFDPAQLFGAGKALARLKTFVICQAPTITMTFTQAESSQLLSDFQVNASVKLSLFGLFSLGSASASYQVQDVQQDSKAGTVTVTFGPPQVSGTIPLQQQTAYVLGGVASYPPTQA